MSTSLPNPCRALLLVVAFGVCALAVSAPAAFSVDRFTATTTQSPPNPVPEGTLVTYTTTVTNVSGEPYPFAWMLPEDPEVILEMFPVRLGTHRAPPNNYISV